MPIDPPMAWAYGDFGNAIAVDGRDLIVADMRDDSACPTFASCNSGVVYTFSRPAGEEWSLRQRIVPADLTEQLAFGSAVAVQYDTMIVGALGASTMEWHDGAAYIFERVAGEWHERHKLLPPVFEQSADFGVSIALLDEWLFIGQPKLNAPGMGDVGAVQVYRREGGEWSFFQSLRPPDPEIGMYFGRAVDADGDALVVGAPGDRERISEGGSAYVFRFDGSAWALEQKLRSAEVQIGMTGGRSVAIEGDTVAMGAPLYETAPALGGAAFIFERDGSAWKQTATITHGDQAWRDWFGASIALADGALFVGARDAGDGAAYVFRRDGAGAWRQVSKLEPPAGLGRSFGEAIAVGGGMVAVGDPVATVSGLPSVGRAFTFDLACALCRVDLDGDGALTFFDFLTFQNLFAAGDKRADFDGSGALDFFDFLAFQDAFAAGC